MPEPRVCSQCANDLEEDEQEVCCGKPFCDGCFDTHRMRDCPG